MENKKENILLQNVEIPLKKNIFKKIPKDWKLQKLGDLCNFTQGIQISSINTLRKKEEGYIRYLYINDFSSDDNKRFVKDIYPSKIISKSDLVMANTGTAGKIFRGKNGVLSNNAFKISPNNSIKSDYLYYYLSTDKYWLDIRRLFNTAGQPHVGHSNISKINFLCPPIQEQEKIVEILNLNDHIIKNIKKQISKIKNLQKGVMFDLMTKGIGNKEFKKSDLGTIPYQWKILPLGDYFSLTSGKSKQKKSLSSKKTYSNPYPVYGGNGITGYAELNLIEQPTIVIGRVGENCGCIHLTEEKSWITDNALYINNISETFDLSFMFYLMTFSNLSKLRSKGGQPLISQKPISEFIVAMPPIEEQQKIACVLDSYSEYILILLKKLQMNIFLKKGLMNSLLSGSKRVI